MKRSILSDNFLPQICRSLFNAVSTRRVLKKAREFCRVCFNFPAQWLRMVTTCFVSFGMPKQR